MRFDTHDAAVGLGVSCKQIDTVLFIRDHQGAVLASDDNGGAGYCSAIELDIRPGETVYAHLLDSGDHNAILEPGYWLYIDFQ
jgi:hypothetical protein